MNIIGQSLDKLVIYFIINYYTKTLSHAILTGLREKGDGECFLVLIPVYPLKENFSPFTSYGKKLHRPYFLIEKFLVGSRGSRPLSSLNQTQKVLDFFLVSRTGSPHRTTRFSPAWSGDPTRRPQPRNNRVVSTRAPVAPHPHPASIQSIFNHSPSQIPLFILY
jgi:hypothetical protein